MQLLVGFTTDRRQLTRAISSLGIASAQRVEDPLRIAYDLGPAGEPGSGLTGGGTELDEHIAGELKQVLKAEQALYAQRVDSFLTGFEDLSRALGSVQGRKQVILLSAGFDSDVVGGRGRSAWTRHEQ